jgi:hypothetical protein
MRWAPSLQAIIQYHRQPNTGPLQLLVHGGKDCGFIVFEKNPAVRQSAIYHVHCNPIAFISPRNGIANGVGLPARVRTP